MFNNIKKEIEKEFDKQKNYNDILSKVEGVSDMRKSKIKYALFPICTIVLAILLFNQSNLFTKEIKQNQNVNNTRWAIKKVERSKNEINNEISTLLHWNEMSITQKFPLVKYNDNEYDVGKAEIPDNMIGENLGAAVLTGRDSYTNATYSKNANLYAIKTLSKECAISVQYEDSSEYYVCTNTYYKPETLKQFMEDLNLREIVSFGTVYYNYFETDKDGNKKYVQVEFPNVSDNIIWEKLFSNTSLKNEHSDTHSHMEIIGISIDIPLLGIENISVSANEDGYIETNILGTGKCFYIGKDKVQEFVNYVIENCEGYQIVYSDKEDDENIDYTKENVIGENVTHIVSE